MALTKAQALALSEPVEKMYMDCASQLIINISKHFATGRGLATQAWEAQKLAEMGQLTDEAIEIIAVNTGQKAEAVRKALYDGIKMGLADEEALLQNAAEKGYVATAGGTLETSMQVRNLVDAYAAQADDQLNLVNTVMLQSTQNRYMLAIQQVISAEEAAKIEMLTSAKNAAELAVQMGKAQNVLNAATGSVLLGNEARTKALRGAIKTLADEGITGFIDAGGHHWTPEAYVNMDIRTTVGNVARQAQKARAAEYGVDTFQVSSHAAARPLCAPYQGWICSWSGGGYTVEDLYGNSYMVHDIKETSYGEPAGLFGINCGHNPLTFVPGYSVPRVAELTPEQEQENALQYAQSQQQRHLEREVRQAKTEALAYEAAGDKEGFALAAAKVKQTQADYMAFCNATDRTPRTDRLQVFGYNRSVSGKATAATRGYKPQAAPVKAVKPAPIIKPDVPVAPVAPPAPVIPAFVPAKDKAAAEQYALRFADSVNYDGVSLKNVNIINERLNELTTKYPINKLQEIGNKSRGVMSASASRLNISGKKLGKALDEDLLNFRASQEVAKTQLENLKKKYPNKYPPFIEKEVKRLQGMLKFERWGITDSYTDHVAVTITHEYGHILSDQYFGMINSERGNPNISLNKSILGMKKKWNDAFVKARETGDIYRISAYSNTKYTEFFAECFAAHEYGEKLPDYIETLLEEVLQNGIMQ